MVDISLKGLHHVGIPVRSLARSLAFYEDVCGVRPTLVAESSGDEVARLVGIDDAVIAFAFLPLGNTNLELLEYQQPKGRDYDSRNCDVGAVHVAFEVGDVDHTCDVLKDKGIPFSGAPLRMTDGPLAGCATVYFKDPDGVQLEAFQAAKG